MICPVTLICRVATIVPFVGASMLRKGAVVSRLTVTFAAPEPPNEFVATAVMMFLPSSSGTSAEKFVPESGTLVRPTVTPLTAGPTLPLIHTCVPLVSKVPEGIRMNTDNGIDWTETNHWRGAGSNSPALCCRTMNVFVHVALCPDGTSPKLASPETMVVFVAALKTWALTPRASAARLVRVTLRTYSKLEPASGALLSTR